MKTILIKKPTRNIMEGVCLNCGRKIINRKSKFCCVGCQRIYNIEQDKLNQVKLADFTMDCNFINESF